VPEYIKLWVGKAARERVLVGVKDTYNLPPAERFRLTEQDIRCHQYDLLDPDTWDTGFFCVVLIPGQLVEAGMDVTWCGNRSSVAPLVL
jgi:hypothetical protein